MGNTNKNMTEAKRARINEFYTQASDIEKELGHYENEFRNKTVFCNCDDPYESEFFKYFAKKFNSLGLKKLICTCYAGSPIITEQLSLFDIQGLVIKKEEEKHPYKIEITEVPDLNNDGAIDMLDVESLIKNKKNTLTLLNGDGDFRSPECIELLKSSDIVVTNPPFSLFKEYITQLVEYDKQFVIIGTTSALTYKEVFPLFMNDKIRTGYTNFNVGMYFFVPDDTKKYHKVLNGRKLVRVAASCWYTNLPVKKHKDKLIPYLTKTYTPSKYSKYFNYDCINVDRVEDIPKDYNGVMGVPANFLDKFNPQEFRLIGCADANIVPKGWKGMPQEFVELYYSQGNTGSYKVGNRLACCILPNGNAKVPFKRVLIEKILDDGGIDNDEN